MNVMYLSDDNYAYIAGISMMSLLENNKDAEYIHIFLVGDNISKENKKKLYETVNSKSRQLTIIDKPDIKSLIGCDVEMHWWVENVFSRVFLDEVFKEFKEVKKLIYLDSDTIVTGNLSDLWEIDLNNCIGAGVLEAMGSLHKRAIGLKREEPYFNAGMFVVDVEKWRKEGFDYKVKSFIESVNGKMEYADESVLNGIAANDMKIISPKYNLTSLSFYFSLDEVKRYRKPFFHYTEAELQEALSDARIIHFTSSFMDVRPWVEGSKHPYAHKWMEYKKRSLWCDKSPMHDNRSYKKKIARTLVLKLPRKMRLYLVGILHAYVKPLRYIVNNNAL